MGLFRRKSKKPNEPYAHSFDPNKFDPAEFNASGGDWAALSDELEGRAAETVAALDQWADALDKASAEYVARFRQEGISSEDAFAIVRSEGGDGSLAARVREDLWAAELTDLNDQEFTVLANEVEQGSPAKGRFFALDAERARRGLPPAPALDMPGDQNPSSTDPEARFMAASDRFWELNGRITGGGASPEEIAEWQRLEIEVRRAMDAIEQSQEAEEADPPPT